MVDFIAKKISYYANNNKELDEMFILDILNLYLNKNNIDNLCKDNNVYSYGSNELGLGVSMSYTYPKGMDIYIANCNKEITNSISNIIPKIKEEFCLTDSKTMITCVKFYYYIKFIMMLSHEVEHVKQNRNYGCIDTLEGILTTLNLKILRDFQKMGISNSKFNVSKIYFIEPIERFASIKSTYNMENIIKKLDTSDIVKNVLLYTLEIDKSYIYISSYIKNRNVKAPLFEYVKHMKNIGEYSLDKLSSSKIDQYILKGEENLSLKDRLFYGYEISDSEFENIKSLKLKIN